MSGQPWFKCYPSDFLNGVSELSPNEIAVYTICLMRMYDEGGPITFDPERIARRCNMRPTSCRQALDSLLTLGNLTLHGDAIWSPTIERWACLGGRETIPASVRAEIYQRDNGRCVYCGSETGSKFHIDHVHPIALGGSSDADNLALSCPPCNLAKGAKLLEEWAS